jgi:hypothetical protein
MIRSFLVRNLCQILLGWWAGHVVSIEKIKNVWTVLMGKPKGKRLFARSWLEGHKKWVLIKKHGLNWLRVWRSGVFCEDCDEISGSIQCEKLTCSGNISCSRTNLLHGISWWLVDWLVGRSVVLLVSLVYLTTLFERNMLIFNFIDDIALCFWRLQSKTCGCVWWI